MVVGLPWRETRLYGCSVTGAPLRFSTVSLTVNIDLASTAISRRNTRPAPLSQVSVTGLPGASAWASAVQTVSGVGCAPGCPPPPPNPAGYGFGLPEGDRSTMFGLGGSTVSR